MEEDLPDIDAEEVEAAGQALKDAAPLQPQEESTPPSRNWPKRWSMRLLLV